MKPERTGHSRSRGAWKLAIGLILIALAIGAVFLNASRHPGTLLATSAWAEAPKPAPTPEEATTAEVADQLSEAPGSVFESNPLERMAQSLKEKERDLAQREQALAEKEARLEGLRKEVEQNLAQTQVVLKKMEELAGQAEVKRKQELDKWIKIYATMGSDQAAQVLVKLDPDFTLQLLSQMEPKKAAKILESKSFPPERAVEMIQKLGKVNP